MKHSQPRRLLINPRNVTMELVMSQQRRDQPARPPHLLMNPPELALALWPDLFDTQVLPWPRLARAPINHLMKPRLPQPRFRHRRQQLAIVIRINIDRNRHLMTIEQFADLRNVSSVIARQAKDTIDDPRRR